jgi:hypothetical protein
MYSQVTAVSAQAIHAMASTISSQDFGSTTNPVTIRKMDRVSFFVMEMAVALN